MSEETDKKQTEEAEGGVSSKKQEDVPANKELEKSAEQHEQADEPKEVPEKFKEIVSTIEEMSVLDLSELVHVLEDAFGVSATQPMMVAGAAMGAATGESGEEEQSLFTIELSAVGDQKINVIKAIREITELSLKEAKDMVDGAPASVRENVGKEQAEEIKTKLEEAGATVTLK